VDWKRIKAEYIAGGTSYRKLAEKYNVPFGTLRKVAKKEGWTQLRTQAVQKADTKMIEAISDDAAEKAINIIDVADKLLERIASVITLVNDTQGLKHISSALKDIKDIKGFKSSADMREQEARIRNLEKQAQTEEGNDKAVMVTILGGEDAYTK
jgi:predicted regulator of amino acid metabolism with ACT domain